MHHHLVVSKAFGPYKAAQTITDEAEIAKIEGSSKMHNVVRVFAPVAPEPEPAPAPVAEPASEAVPQA